MKNYEEFVEKLASEMRKKAEKGKFLINKVTENKMNIGTQEGISVQEVQNSFGIVYYPRKEYVEYRNGKTLETLACEILGGYSENQFEDIESILNNNFQMIKNAKIKCKVLNKNKNMHMLSEVVYQEFLDLIVVFYVSISQNMSITIKNEHLNIFGITKEELINKVEPQKFVICSMLQAIHEMVEIGNSEIEEDFLYILTNEEKCFGANTILEKECFLQAIELLKENFYILPSSLHELLLIPESKAPTKEELKEMVSSINNSNVAEKDFLSNSIYYFNGTEVLLA